MNVLISYIYLFSKGLGFNLAWPKEKWFDQTVTQRCGLGQSGLPSS